MSFNTRLDNGVARPRRHGSAGDLPDRERQCRRTPEQESETYSTAISPPFWIGQNAFA